MKLLVLMLGLALPGFAQSPAVAVPEPWPHAQAERDVIALANEAGAFVRQALAEPNDSVVLARLLHGPEVARLKQRMKQLEPALARWRQSLSAAQMEAAYQGFLQGSQFRKDMDWLETDAAVEARFKRNPDLKSTVEWTLYEILMQ